jgi:hypothetical protein
MKLLDKYKDSNTYYGRAMRFYHNNIKKKIEKKAKYNPLINEGITKFNINNSYV